MRLLRKRADKRDSMNELTIVTVLDPIHYRIRHSYPSIRPESYLHSAISPSLKSLHRLFNSHAFSPP